MKKDGYHEVALKVCDDGLHVPINLDSHIDTIRKHIAIRLTDVYSPYLPVKPEDLHVVFGGNSSPHYSSGYDLLISVVSTVFTQVDPDTVVRFISLVAEDVMKTLKTVPQSPTKGPLVTADDFRLDVVVLPAPLGFGSFLSGETPVSPT